MIDGINQGKYVFFCCPGMPNVSAMNMLAMCLIIQLIRRVCIVEYEASHV